MMTRAHALVLLLSLALASTACGSPDPWTQEDPSLAARYFLSAVHNQDQEAIWRMLTPDTQQMLDKRAQSINAGTKGQAVKPQELVSGLGFMAPYKVSKIRVTPPAPSATDGTRVQLLIETQTDKAWPLDMVRVEGSWRVIMGGPSTNMGE